MSRSFGIVEEKLAEAEYFLNRLAASRPLSPGAKYSFSAFVSAARSVTLAMQACLAGVDGFEQWYEGAQDRLKADPLAKYFVEIRNDVVHTGMNPLAQVPPEHLQKALQLQLTGNAPPHFLIVPDPENNGTTMLAAAIDTATTYFTSLAELVFDCYANFKRVVDPRWYFTEEHFRATGKTLEDALVELGFPPSWLKGAPEARDPWRAIRMQQPPCQLNDIFVRYVKKQIDDPDASKSTVPVWGAN